MNWLDEEDVIVATCLCLGDRRFPLATIIFGAGEVV